MEIKLQDINGQYTLKIETNDEFKKFLVIENSVGNENIKFYGLGLSHDGIVELIKTLQFMLDFVKD